MVLRGLRSVVKPAVQVSECRTVGTRADATYGTLKGCDPSAQGNALGLRAGNVIAP